MFAVGSVWVNGEAVRDVKCCPLCRYPIRGLQPPFRCPECGAQFDITTVVWRPARRWAMVWFSFAGLPCAVALISVLFRGMSDAVMWLLGAGMMWLPFAWVRYRKSRLLLLVSTRTLEMYRQHRMWQVLAYDKIANVEVGKLTGDVHVDLGDGSGRFIIPYDFFRNSKSARRFVNILRGRIEKPGRAGR